MDVRRSRDEMLEALKAAGCRVTRQRVAIIDRLAGRDDHPSVRQIRAEASAAAPGISLATVSNTVGTLAEMGLVREIDFEAADNRYDTNLAPHLNPVCTSCGAIFDLHHELPMRPEEVLQRSGFETLGVRMEYRETCAECRRSTPARRRTTP